MAPETHYATSGEVQIAYQVIGNGPLDLVVVPGYISNFDHTWDEPSLVHLLSRLNSFSRLILFDKGAPAYQIRLPIYRPLKSAWTTYGLSWMQWVASALRFLASLKAAQ